MIARSRARVEGRSEGPIASAATTTASRTKRGSSRLIHAAATADAATIVAIRVLPMCSSSEDATGERASEVVAAPDDGRRDAVRRESQDARLGARRAAGEARGVYPDERHRPTGGKGEDAGEGSGGHVSP
jgi:hypothetical protein